MLPALQPQQHLFPQAVVWLYLKVQIHLAFLISEFSLLHLPCLNLPNPTYRLICTSEKSECPAKYSEAIKKKIRFY